MNKILITIAMIGSMVLSVGMAEPSICHPDKSWHDATHDYYYSEQCLPHERGGSAEDQINKIYDQVQAMNSAGLDARVYVAPSGNHLTVDIIRRDGSHDITKYVFSEDAEYTVKITTFSITDR